MVSSDIDGYCLKIRSKVMLARRDPKTALHPRESWQFLCKLSLLRLKVEIDQEEPETPPKAHEVSHHALQLRSFLLTVGPGALTSVTSLQLTLGAGIASSSSGGGQPTLPTSMVLAHLLATACPKLQHLAIRGSTRGAVLRVFGHRCPAITSLELPRSDDRLKRLSSVLRNEGVEGGPLPLGLPPEREPEPSQCITALSAFPRLLRLRAEGAHHLSHARGWLALPPALEELRGGSAAPWDVELLSALLQAAPSLRSITVPPHGGNSVHLGCATKEHLKAMQRVNLRLQAGVEMEHLSLRCGPDVFPENSSGLPPEYLLPRLFCFPQVLTCRLSTGTAAPPSAGCLLQLGRAFPHITTLRLSGNFGDTHLSDISSCKHLTSLELQEAKLLTAPGLCRHIRTSPQLKRVQHRFGTAVRTTAALQALLTEAQPPAAAGAAARDVSPPLDVSDWVVERLASSSLGDGDTWARKQPATVGSKPGCLSSLCDLVLVGVCASSDPTLATWHGSEFPWVGGLAPH
ncbi:MAG: hypothetical protein WDW38_009255 [Sanguina aurantia]